MKPTIIEMRTCTLKPTTVPAFEEHFGAALPERVKLSPLAAFWHTEVGVLNQVIHVWTYPDLNTRAHIRAEALKLDHWPAMRHTGNARFPDGLMYRGTEQPHRSAALLPPE